ncbi:MAG: phosphatase PAP2 family protein [Bacteroidota bacterium]|nr:phosphatase PAP2 family protein [Bacteroidota bacterium]
MNEYVIDNYRRLRPALFFLPLILLAAIAWFLFKHHALQADQYVEVQRPAFMFINHHLGQYPNIIYNITQVGDALIFLSLLSIFIVYAPKLWEALLSASLLSMVLSSVLKNLFLVPRPAVALDNSSFIIIGERAVGHASLPSGHSITVFTTLTVLMFAFMPRKTGYKVLWILLTAVTGLLIAFTRVGVGAHYPLDVIIGSIVGFISGLSGIFISRNYKIWAWVGNKKYHPVFIGLMLVCFVIVVSQIVSQHLIIFYLACASLAFALYKLVYAIIKK